jgi:hypothetical protein
MQKLFVFAVISVLFGPALAEELEGDYLYRVSTVRAATGSLSELLDAIHELKSSRHFRDAGTPEPLVMRHSQGDQWDLLIISPMESWETYYKPAAVQKRNDARAAFAEQIRYASDRVAFAEDHFALGPEFSTLQDAFADNAFFHIEMFKAAAGKSADLLEQRRMENVFLAATGQTQNMIFRRAAGSDVDVFTIGFHLNLEAFARPADVTAEERESAAKAAGFRELADISFYLRSLISGHHDTLAVKVE